MRRIFAIFLRQFFLIKGSPVRFINIFSWILIDVLLWGFITRYLGQVGSSGFNFTSVFLGAVVLWGFLSQMQRGFILAMLEDVYTRNYLNLFSSPLRVGEYLAGLTLSALLSTGVAIAAVLVMCAYVFGFSLATFGPALIPFILTLCIFGIALGTLASALVIRIGPAGEWLAWPIPALIQPFVGVFYSLSVLPHWMQTVSLVIPPSYVFEGMRTVVFGGHADTGSLWTGVLLSLVYLLVAYGIFLWVYRYALRHGLVARFSAETGS